MDMEEVLKRLDRLERKSAQHRAFEAKANPILDQRAKVVGYIITDELLQSLAAPDWRAEE